MSASTSRVIVKLRIPRRRAPEIQHQDLNAQTGQHLELVDYGPSAAGTWISGADRCVLECELRRLRCPTAECATTQSPGPGRARPTPRDFEDVVAFLAQRIAKTPITRLMRVAQDSVSDIIARVVVTTKVGARLSARDRLVEGTVAGSAVRPASGESA
jgi:hypothetical protein